MSNQPSGTGTKRNSEIRQIRFAKSSNNDAVAYASEGTPFLLSSSEVTGPILIHRDSEFSVSSDYDDAGEHNTLNAWQGATLLTADCLGTGLLALPSDIRVLGLSVGLGFLVLQLPINYYAGCIFHQTAAAVEERQQLENRVYSSSLASIPDNDDDDAASHRTTPTAPSAVHHDTATFDFIGMTVALFQRKRATYAVMMVYYVNIFLVLGNYILVMSHAVAAAIGEETICLPTAGLLSAASMFAVSQSGRTMAKLGRTASLLSLTALLIVILQCLWAIAFVQQQQGAQQETFAPNSMPIITTQAAAPPPSMLKRLSALGSIGFAVGSQKLFLNIRHELADRNDAPKSLGMSLSAFGTCYVLLCLAAGPNPPSFLFDAIPIGTRSRHVAGVLLWIHVVVSYAINSQALCSSMDRLLWRRWTGGISNTLRDAKPALRWAILTGVMAITAFTVANAVPFFTDLVALIGAITTVPLTLLLPALFWRKHLQVPLWLPTANSVWSISLTYFSLAFIVTATLGSLDSIGSDWSTHGAPFSCH